jgi:hypothetical protein
MPMTRSQYDELRKELQGGRRVVYFEGRSAATVAELDWIATEVYGLKLGGAVPKAEPVKPADTSSQPSTETTPPKEPSGKDGDDKQGGKDEGQKVAAPNLARANLETLRKVATEKGIEFPPDATRGQLLDLISKADKEG